jgi:hypothetical protein
MNLFLKWRVNRFIKNQAGWVTPRQLVRKFPFTSPVVMATTLMSLKNEKKIAMYYKVKFPDGTLSNTSYKDPRMIPDVICDSRGVKVDTAAMDCVPVFCSEL